MAASRAGVPDPWREMALPCSAVRRATSCIGASVVGVTTNDPA